MKCSLFHPAVLAGVLACVTGCSQANAAATTDAGPSAAPAVKSPRLDKTTVLAQDQSIGLQLVATDDAVFFSGNGGVTRVPSTGGPATVSVPTQRLVRFLAATNDDLVVEQSSDLGLDVKQLANGAGPAPVAMCSGLPKDETPALDEPRFVADAKNIYWRTINDVDFNRPNSPRANFSTLYRCSRSGGAAVVIAKNVRAGAWGALALAGRQLLVSSELADLRSISLDDGKVKDLLTTSGNHYTSIASDGEYAYLAYAGSPMPRTLGSRYKDGRIERVPLAGGQLESLSRDQEWPEHLVVDSTSTYWTTRDHKVKRGKNSGGGVEVLGAYEQTIEAIAVNKYNVYWSLGGTSENAHRDGSVIGRGK